MTRRDTLERLSAVAVGVLSMGHSPYRQWYVYRRLRLFIATSAADPRSHPLGEAIATVLALYLPDSHALTARALDSLEIAKLLGSQQLDVGLLTAQEAPEALEGTGRFADNGPVPLRALACVGDYLLVCRSDFPDPKAYEIARTLVDRWNAPAPFEAVVVRLPRTPQTSIPPHPAVLDGERVSRP